MSAQPPGSPFPFPPSPPSAPPLAPAAHQGAGFAQAPVTGGYPVVDPEVVAAREKAGTAMGWGIAGALAGGLAFVVALVALGSSVVGGSGLGDDGYFEPLRGEVVGLSDGAALSGDRLAYAIDALQRDWGYDMEDLSCPDTAAVSTSTVVVCTGSIDGFDWTGAVLFEDASGSFVVAEF